MGKGWVFHQEELLKGNKFLLILPEGHVQKKSVKGAVPDVYLECWAVCGFVLISL